jgi:hypothetical protein
MRKGVSQSSLADVMPEILAPFEICGLCSSADQPGNPLKCSLCFLTLHTQCCERVLAAYSSGIDAMPERQEDIISLMPPHFKQDGALVRSHFCQLCLRLLQ